MCHLTLNAPRADARLCSDRRKRSAQTRFYVLSQHSLGVPTFPKDPAAEALLRRHAMSPRRDVTGRRAGERGGPGPEGRAIRERRPAARPGGPRASGCPLPRPRPRPVRTRRQWAFTLLLLCLPWCPLGPLIPRWLSTRTRGSQRGAPRPPVCAPPHTGRAPTSWWPVPAARQP